MRDSVNDLRSLAEHWRNIGWPEDSRALTTVANAAEEVETLRASLARAEAERDALDARVAKAEEVVSCARVLGTYDWESRLDDSRPSDDAKIDARELGIAVWHYDEFVRARDGTGKAGR